MRAVRIEMAPIDPEDDLACAELVTGLTRAVTLMQPHLDAAKQEDWIAMVLDELAGEPLSLALEAVSFARRSCRYPSEFIPTVLSLIQPRKARLLAQMERYSAIEAACR